MDISVTHLTPPAAGVLGGTYLLAHGHLLGAALFALSLGAWLTAVHITAS